MNYIGIDIGDGESCVCVLPEKSDIEPRPIAIAGRKSFLSAVAIGADGEVCIGQDAVRGAALKELSVRFKSRFLEGNPDDDRSMARFMHGIFERLKRQHLLAEDDQVVVGCPAGWDGAARERYLSLLRQAGFPSPRLASESRAAFLYAKHARAIQLEVDLANESALVIDIGSSTLDFAYVVDGRETNVGTFGNVYLGGGAIDEALLSASVDASPQKADILETFKAAPQWRGYCLLAARQLKEEYFTLEAQGEGNIQCNHSVTLLYDQPITLGMRANEPMILRVVKLKIDALGGTSFFSMLDHALLQACRQTEKRPPSLVLLTGGASKMKFFEEQCRARFANARFVVCGEPEYSIAKGLAYCARMDDGILRFNRAIDKFLQEDTVYHTVRGQTGGLIDRVSACIADIACERARIEVSAWQRGRYQTLEEMNRAITQSMAEALSSQSAAERIDAVIREKMEAICLKLQPRVDAICREHGVAPSQMNLKGSAKALSSPVSSNIKVEGDISYMQKAVQAAITSLIACVMALIPGGHLVDFAVIVLSGLAVLLGRDYIGQMTASMTIPLRLRALVGVDKIISDKVRQRLLNQIRDGLSRNEALWEGIAAGIEANVTEYVSRLAQKTEIAITMKE